MKKFVFSLQKLKEYREQLLETEKNTLGIMRRDLNSMNDELKELNLLLERLRGELSAKLSEGTNPVEISTVKRYIAVKQQEVHELRRRIMMKQHEIDKQLEKVIDATKDVSTLEKLEENQREEYKHAAQKEEELFIEEFVSNADWRKAHGEE